MKKILYCICIFLLSFSLYHNAFADFIDDDSDDEGIKHQQIYHLYDGVDLISQSNISYAKPRIVLKAIYPELQSPVENENILKFNMLITDLIKEEAGAYRQRVLDRKNYQNYQDTLLKSDIKNDLVIDYDASVVNISKHKIISVRLSVQGTISGLEHPYHYHRVLNFDLDTGEKIELSDLFKPESDYLNILSEYARKGLARKLSNKEMMLEGTQPTAENFKNWNLKPTGLLITFDEYKVAPYVAGTQFVHIPYSALKKYINKETPLGSCLEKRSTCVRYNVMTGGFVDQAINNKALKKANFALISSRGIHLNR